MNTLEPGISQREVHTHNGAQPRYGQSPNLYTSVS